MMIKHSFEYATSFLAAILPELHNDRLRQETLLEDLTRYVSDNDSVKIRALLAPDHDLALVIAGLKTSTRSPLHDAAAHGHTYALQAMLERLPFDMWNLRKSTLERTPLMLAAENGHADVIIEYRNAVRQRHLTESLPATPTVIDYAANLIKAQLGYDTPPENVDGRWKSIVDAKDVNGDTPLILALNNRHLLCVRLLLMMQADLQNANVLGENGLTLLYEILGDHKVRDLLINALPFN